MKSENDIKKFYKKAAVNTNPETDKTVLNRILAAQTKTNIWRLITKSPITKFVAAAVIILSISFVSWLVMSDSKISQKPEPKTITSIPNPSVNIKLYSNYGYIVYASGETISTKDSDLKILYINDKHKIIMNENTSLAIRPLVAKEQTGCIINLNYGEIYAHVENDGNPFIVETAHGQAVIKGTTFGIKTIDTGTTLIVVDGTVKLVSRDGSVEVSADYKSEIIAMSTPTVPSLCDAKELTSWATNYELKKH